MNYKLLLGLEMEENKVLRKKLQQLELEIANLQTEKEQELMMKVSAESELDFMKDSIMHINNKITGYTKNGGTILNERV